MSIITRGYGHQGQIVTRGFSKLESTIQRILIVYKFSSTIAYEFDFSEYINNYINYSSIIIDSIDYQSTV